MINLPEWKLTLTAPLYDTSSLSPIEQTAQVYSKMRELIAEFNTFTASITEEINRFETQTIGSIDTYKQEINLIVHNAICNFDEKITKMMNDIDEAVLAEIEKMNINEIVAEEVKKLSFTYNPETEELVIGG